jgi:hypothetical protein
MMNPKQTPLSRRLVRHVIAFCLVAMTYPVAADVPVIKTVEPFEAVTWKVADDCTASGNVKSITDVAPELAAISKSALDLEVDFSGKGFEYFQCIPREPLTIPGVTKKVSLWVRNNSKYSWVLQFKDGWGRSEVNGQKLEWNITKGADGTWKKVTFNVPTNWVQPISVVGAFVHNWDNRNEKASANLSLDQLEVETDISDVDEATGVLNSWKAAPPVAGKTPQTAPVTPLRKASLTATGLHNVFSGEQPRFLLTAQNWHAGSATGTLGWKVSDSEGRMLKSGTQPISVTDNLALTVPLDTPKYDVYRFDATITWSDGKKTTTSQPYAVIPVPRELTDAEKDASPYGLNVHSFRLPMVSTFRKAGIIWFRDYAFSFQSLLQAKGEDNKYNGWPYYPKIIKGYDDNGVRVLADLQTSIRPPREGVPPGPDLTWTKEMAGILLAFPSLRAVELDNEYDLNGGHAKAEEAIDWKNYGLFHKKFADMAQLLGDGHFIPVENGRAGIWPERLRRMVQTGDYANIKVVNSHHYTGVEPPEFNAINHNMGFSGDETVMSLYDQLRAAKKAGSSDGILRQHWLTEFGWDTKAGPVVSPVEQAAYLARMYMLLSAAGTDKGFWFFDLDAPTSNQFFDGCGLFTYDQMPKLSYTAYAGLTQILPTPEFIGTINAGENTWGYLFRNDGKLVATLWTMDNKPGPTVDFGSAKVYDYFANPLEKSAVALSIKPVYAVGVSETSLWARQAAYSLESHHLISVTAGDVVTADLKVKNTRSTAINGTVRLLLPPGWADVSGETNIAVPPGQSVDIPLQFHINADEPLGEKVVRLAISEGEPLHTIPLHVQIQRALVMTVRGLKGEPGNGDVHVRISNRSVQPINGTLSFKLPTEWSTTTPTIKIDNLKPMEVRDVPVKVQWTTHWKEGETATVEYRSTDGRSVQQPLIPSQLTIYSAPNLVMDGDLKKWPTRTKLPDWVLGSTFGPAKASIYLSWSSKGLQVAVEVDDSKTSVPDPRNFWVGDVLELFVDTHDRKTPRPYEVGDHQFWLAPQVDQKRVYVGQWKRNTEIPETHYDITGIQSIAVRKGNGYVMECLIPANLIQGFQPVAGARLGLNLNLSVKGIRQNREVFWSLPKSESAEQPAAWGTVTLAN